MKKLLFILLLLNIQPLSAQAPVGGRCEGCEAVFENTVPFDQLGHEVYLPDWKDQGPQMIIRGRVFKKDGKTPAENVVLYVYHTDQKGIYPVRDQDKGWARRHGYIRGWLKTNARGEYAIYTLNPAAYPNERFAAHIHVFVKEPDKNPYYIDEYLFDGDPFLTENEINPSRPRGSKGLIRLARQNGLLEGKRDITLGLNIPGYH